MITEEQRAALIETLRELDQVQRMTDALGDREVAWYHYRDRVEDALQLERGALVTGGRDVEDVD